MHRRVLTLAKRRAPAGRPVPPPPCLSSAAQVLPGPCVSCARLPPSFHEASGSGHAFLKQAVIVAALESHAGTGDEGAWK